MRTFMKLFSAVALAALVSGSAQALTIGMTGDFSTLSAAGGVITITTSISPDASGINNQGFDIDSLSSGPSVLDLTGVTVAYGAGPTAMAEAFGPPILSGAGHIDNFSLSSVGASGPTSGTFINGIATFLIGAGAPGDTVVFSYSGAYSEIFFANNSNVQVFPVSLPTWTVTLIPEPGTLALLGFGLSGLAIVGRRRS